MAASISTSTRCLNGVRPISSAVSLARHDLAVELSHDSSLVYPSSKSAGPGATAAATASRRTRLRFRCINPRHIIANDTDHLRSEALRTLQRCCFSPHEMGIFGRAEAHYVHHVGAAFLN